MSTEAGVGTPRFEPPPPPRHGKYWAQLVKCQLIGRTHYSKGEKLLQKKLPRESNIASETTDFQITFLFKCQREREDLYENLVYCSKPIISRQFRKIALRGSSVPPRELMNLKNQSLKPEMKAYS